MMATGPLSRGVTETPAETDGRTIRVLLVDDEAPAREGVRIRLAHVEDFEIVGEASDGEEALRAIEDLRPDAVFLDVQMPGLDGFEVLANLHPELPTPVVVFLTAYDEHALRAFDVHALDYLLKPVTDDRFQRALARVRTEVGRRGGERENRGPRESPALWHPISHQPREGRRTGGSDATPLLRIPVRIGRRFRLVRVDTVDWFEAAKNYVRMYVGAETLLARTTMRQLEARLDPAAFARIHRSAIVNLERIHEVRPDPGGRMMVVLVTGQQIPLGRSYRESLLRSS